MFNEDPLGFILHADTDLYKCSTLGPLTVPFFRVSVDDILCDHVKTRTESA